MCPNRVMRVSPHAYGCVKHVAFFLCVRIMGEHFKPGARVMRWGGDDAWRKFHEEIRMLSSGIGRSTCGGQDSTDRNRGRSRLCGL